MAELDLLAADLSTTGRSLRRAATRGAIRVQRPSPNRAELTSGERRYLRSHWSLLSVLTQALRTEKNVRLAVLFGSSARGDDRPGSDVDLLVELADHERRLPLARLGLKLESLIGRPVQVVALRDAVSSPALLLDVICEGRVLIDRDGGWERLRRRERTLRRQAAARELQAQAEAWQALDELARP